jgi:acyl transferase domain-containing protein/NAD(P)H-dependent flavin oxidoreductase YrpB (nitropropane dioxygenase family)/NAD(P)-dependent dehydrogenase (short-subunit alcohol dehydrogenase family)/acyl carrier protein
MTEIPLPDQVTKVLLPWGLKPPPGESEIFWQVHSVAEAEAALAARERNLVLKGCEGAGLCGEASTFILFQRLVEDCQRVGAAIYLQGGVGVHTAAAYMALGARGVLFDSQLALFPECGAPGDLKAAIGKLNGSEISHCEGFHYYSRPGSAGHGEVTTLRELLPRLGAGLENCLPLGQDAILSTDFVARYKKLKHFVRAARQAAFSHLKLARSRDDLCPGNDLAASLGIRYPIAQGPMARVSDVPEFLGDVSEGGALPFLAMSLMTGKSAANALKASAEIMGDRPWGVGLLGFAYPNVLEEQTRLILEARPHAVLIAGGRPSQAKIFEREGIKVFLHVPAAGLLEIFLKEGARSFIFEGRESGGHVGPLSSTVLWEKQINRLLKQETRTGLSIFFAGGIHDARSAAFVRVMAAPLAARDANIGVLMGSAYLCTQEIVARKAITGDYQKQLIDAADTLLLKSGNGQETRSVHSPYTDFFLREKRRMEQEGLDAREILMRLEALNLGRLRIAAKGVERQGDTLVDLSAEEQREKGLFMAGSVTALINQVTSIAALHDDVINGSRQILQGVEPPVEPAPAKSAADIAIVGMACVFPDAENVDEYWKNILFGRDSIREVPPERWPVALFYDPDTKDTDHTISKWGAFIDAVDFDALEFGIAPQSLAAIEPVQLLSLLVAKRALEDAGYKDLSGVDLDDTSVIFAAQAGGELAAAYGSRSGLMRFFGEIPEEAASTLPRLTEDSFPGVLSNVISGRISNRLNTGGRNFTIDAACASSLAALDIACDELVSGKSDMVVLGGADLHNGINDFLMFSSTYALSRKGRCLTFDTGADGISLGEGVGVLILKRLEDAERDGSRIHAVIKGVGGSSDGKVLGLTAPSRHGQMKALERAYERAGVQPSQVGLVEAHGTGTAVGDKIEIGALSDIFVDSGALPRQTRLGSVKTQIGHTKCAAGVAGLIKAVLCVRHGLLPPTLNLNHPNDAYTKNSPFTFRTEKTGFWNENRRIAGVSGFGFGGANFHVIVQNHDERKPASPLKAWPSELFVFRGDNPEESHALMEKVQALFAVNNRFPIRDIAYSLATCNEKPVQCAIVAGSRGELLDRIALALSGTGDENIFTLDPVEGKVAFLFSGQGSQRVNMAADLFLLFPETRRLLDEHPEYGPILFPDAVFSDEERKSQRAMVTDTRNAQPLLGIVDLAIAGMLDAFGIEADMLAGHSYGELPALCHAGALQAADLIPLSRRRAESILAAAGDDPGRMAAVLADPQTLAPLLEGETEVWAVNYNTPRQTVVAGTCAGLGTFLQKLKEAKIVFDELNVACAFHSPLLARAEGLFASVLEEISVRKPTLPVWSNTTAGIYPETAAEIRERLAKHLVNPVRFSEQIEKMHEDGARIFIEAGPGSVLTGLVEKTLKDKAFVTIQTERGGKEGLSCLLKGLARYISTGRSMKLNKLFEGRDATRLDFDNPEQYKKNATVWNVDGSRALPENGNLPSHAGKHVQGPILSLDRIRSASGANTTAESIMMAYLDNMNALIQDQRDVMLGYLGQPDIVPRAPVAQRQFVLANPPSPSPAKETAALDGEAGGETSQHRLPDIFSLSTERITDLLLAIVSEKTGYPIDMLGLDVNLEADLSIDSIKKMEIMGGLRDHVNFPENSEDVGEAFEKIATVKTLRDLVAWVKEMGDAAATGDAPKDAAPGFTGAKALVDTVPLPSSGETSNIVRMTLSAVPTPLAETDRTRLQGKSFAVSDDENGLAASVVEALAEAGATAEIITAEATDLSGYDGLIVINSAASNVHHSPFDLFRLLKTADMEKLEWIFTFDDIPGMLLRAREWTDISRLEGFAGFMKALCHEYPSKRLCAVSFDTAIDAKTFAAIVTDELADAKTFPEIFYKDNERHRLLPRIEETRTAGDGVAAMGLDETANIIVLGGAQGISPAVVSRLASVCPCHYILVGRTSNQAEKEEYKTLATPDEIRKYLIDTEGMKSLREIEEKVKKIHKCNQIHSATKLIEGTGARVSYYGADVMDADEFRGIIAQIRQDCGRIDGIIHAAGIMEDKLFQDKDPASFKRVYQTKKTPLGVILKELLPDLKLLVMFSSMSSTFGNIGQCDYAAGNSVLDLVARIARQRNPALRTITFNWGPWKGAGMINPSLENELRRKGLSFLQMDTGSAFFVNEIMCGNDSNVLAVAGWPEEFDRFIQTAFQ